MTTQITKLWLIAVFCVAMSSKLAGEDVRSNIVRWNKEDVVVAVDDKNRLRSEIEGVVQSDARTIFGEVPNNQGKKTEGIFGACKSIHLASWRLGIVGVVTTLDRDLRRFYLFTLNRSVGIEEVRSSSIAKEKLTITTVMIHSTTSPYRLISLDGLTDGDSIVAIIGNRSEVSSSTGPSRTGVTEGVVYYNNCPSPLSSENGVITEFAKKGLAE